jgi:hypothetical protein
MKHYHLYMGIFSRKPPPPFFSQPSPPPAFGGVDPILAQINGIVDTTDPESVRVLAGLLEVQSKYDKRVDVLLKIAADLGDAEAMRLQAHRREIQSIPAWSIEGVTLLEKAAQAGSLEAMVERGRIAYLRGAGPLAQEWVYRAAELGHIPAMMLLGEWCDNWKQYETARKWYALANNGGKGDLPSKLIWSQESTDNSSRKSNSTNRPQGRLIRNAKDAEQVAAEWMKFFGFLDAKCTPPGKDGGIDVESKLSIAQVKMEAVSTSRPTVQALAGIASFSGKTAFFFSSAGFTREALEWGTDAGVVMFTFDLQGTPEPLNAKARNLLPN